MADTSCPKILTYGHLPGQKLRRLLLVEPTDQSDCLCIDLSPAEAVFF